MVDEGVGELPRFAEVEAGRRHVDELHGDQAIGRHGQHRRRRHGQRPVVDASLAGDEVRVRTGPPRCRVGTGVRVMDWIKQAESLGAGEIVLNVMNADGTTAGYDLEMTAAVSDAVKIPVVASGGAGSPQHMLDVLTTGHADAALAASIFHFNQFTVGQVKQFLATHGVPVRLV